MTNLRGNLKEKEKKNMFLIHHLLSKIIIASFFLILDFILFKRFFAN